ncbi:hypothetical protein CFP56_001149 [Quercus suber]|uniref:Uncharacterized protein n=1 Tax=Quercus suber TaxID=58331 RepID=A0AAW0LHE8_QUESU
MGGPWIKPFRKARSTEVDLSSISKLSLESKGQGPMGNRPHIICILSSRLWRFRVNIQKRLGDGKEITRVLRTPLKTLSSIMASGSPRARIDQVFAGANFIDKK